MEKEKYAKLEGETYDEFCIRIYRNQDAWNLKNDVVGFIINQEYPENSKDESAHRKNTRKYLEGYDDGYKKRLEETADTISETESNGGIKTLMPKTHLSKFEDILGEYNIKKREMQLERLDLSKLVRDVTPYVLLTEQYKNLLKSGEIKIPEFDEFEPISDNENGTILKCFLSDLHIGVSIDEDYNIYNLNVAKRRLNRYADKLLETAKLENCTEISITILGDIIEGSNMRLNQQYDLELTLSEQLVAVQKLILQFVLKLAKHCNISLGGVLGNHDRLVGEKSKSVGRDNAVYVVMKNIYELLQFAKENGIDKFDNIKILESEDFGLYQVEQIFNKTLRYQHGHLDSKGDEKKIEKYNGTDNTQYDIIVFGHLHHGIIIRRNRDTFEMYSGGLQGSNEYGKTKVKSTADASQGVIIFRKNGDVVPFEINLQNS